MTYYVYLLASKKHGTLYLGVTNDIMRREYEHEPKLLTASRRGTASTSLSGLRFMTMR